MSKYHFLRHKVIHKATDGSVWKTQNANTRYNSIKLSRVNSRTRWLNGEYTNTSRTTLCSRHLWGEELYNYDASPLRIYTCPNTWLTVGGDLEPGVRAGLRYTTRTDIIVIHFPWWLEEWWFSKRWFTHRLNPDADARLRKFYSIQSPWKLRL
jgi:hypothetical protein